MSNILQEYFNRRTPENTELYNAYRRGEVDIFGNPAGTPLAVSSANPNLTDTSVIPTTPTTTTSVDTTTDSQPPSTDVSSPTLFTETREQSQARESVTDNVKKKLETQFKQQYENLAQGGYRYQGKQADLDNILRFKQITLLTQGLLIYLRLEKV